jgi:hypothetical protein
MFCPKSQEIPDSHHHPLPKEYAMNFKHLTLSAALMFACAVASIAQQTSQINTKYDRFEDRTSVILDYMLVTSGKLADVYEGKNQIELGAAYQCLGNVKSCKPDRVNLSAIVTTNEHEYRGPARLNVLADGERLSLGNMKNLGKAGEQPALSLFNTVLLIDMPYETFVKFAKANKVEMKLDDTEFELNKEQRSAFSDFALLTYPKAPPK